MLLTHTKFDCQNSRVPEFASPGETPGIHDGHSMGKANQGRSSKPTLN